MRAYLQSLGGLALAGLCSAGVSLFALTAWAADANCVVANGPSTGAKTETNLCTDDTQFLVGQQIDITVRFFDQNGVFIDPDSRNQIYTLRLTQTLEDSTRQKSECDINIDQHRDCKMTRKNVGEYDYSFTSTVASDWEIALLWRCGTSSQCSDKGPIVVSKINITVILPEPNIVISSSPAGRTITADGVSYQSPHTFEWAFNSCHTISAPSPQLAQGTRYLFKNWDDGKPQTHSVCATSESAQYVANFDVQYLLQLSASPSAEGQVLPKDPTWVAAGSSARIEAKPQPGFCFVQWTGDLPPEQRTKNPASVLMDKPKSLVANFAECAKITVTTDPPGLKILVDGIVFTNPPATFRWLVGSTHSLGADSPQPGGTGVRYLFDHWSDTGHQTHNVIAPTADTTYTAVFRPQYLLTTSASPPVGGTVAPSTGQWFDAGATATATATPAKCFGFSGWQGDASSSQNPLSLTMNGPKNVIARFFTGNVDLRFETTPSGLTLTIDGVDYKTPQGFSWPICSPHTLNAPSPQVGQPGVRYLFGSWSDKGKQSHTITTPGATVTFTANFAAQCALTATAIPANWGRVRPSGTVWLPCGASVTLRAVARSGAVFAQWRGDASGSANPLTIVLDRPKNIIAFFNAIPHADFSFSPTTPKAGNPIQFTDLSTDPNGDSDIVARRWSFGDGTASDLRNPVHSYQKSGRFKVCLTVTDAFGSASKTTCKQVTIAVNTLSSASFAFIPSQEAVEEVRVRVFSVTGRLVFDSLGQHEARVVWELDGTVTNGVYLYLISVRAANSTKRTTSVHKLVVLR